MWFIYIIIIREWNSTKTIPFSKLNKKVFALLIELWYSASINNDMAWNFPSFRIVIWFKLIVFFGTSFNMKCLFEKKHIIFDHERGTE